MQEIILVLNAGSSSLKFKVFDMQNQIIALGQIEGIDLAPSFVAKDSQGEIMATYQWSAQEAHQHALVLEYLVTWIMETFKGYQLKACGHRVVHGGTIFKESVLIDDGVIANIRNLIPLAPLHQPHHLRIIELMQKMFKELPQIAVFDTAFHQSMQGNAIMFAIPYRLYQEGVRRYGMHGISYAYIMHQLKQNYPHLSNQKLIVAHIGSGASLCAIENGRSVMTTMGMTALDGVPMGTRPGSIDPGVLLYLMENKNYGVDEMRDFLYHQSGVMGLSEFSSNFYTLECNMDTHEGARRALEFMTLRVAEEIARLMVWLGGCEGIIFTAGVGENSAYFRAEVCKHLAYLGVQLDENKNLAGKEECISTKQSSFVVLRIPTNEELMIALDAKDLSNGSKPFEKFITNAKNTNS